MSSHKWLFSNIDCECVPLGSKMWIHYSNDVSAKQHVNVTFQHSSQLFTIFTFFPLTGAAPKRIDLTNSIPNVYHALPLLKFEKNRRTGERKKEEKKRGRDREKRDKNTYMNDNTKLNGIEMVKLLEVDVVQHTNTNPYG